MIEIRELKDGSLLWIVRYKDAEKEKLSSRMFSVRGVLRSCDKAIAVHEKIGVKFQPYKLENASPEPLSICQWHTELSRFLKPDNKDV